MNVLMVCSGYCPSDFPGPGISRPASHVRMKTPWPFSVVHTALLVAFDMAVIALVGFVLFSGYVI